jgi:hypothetical protein
MAATMLQKPPSMVKSLLFSLPASGWPMAPVIV